MALATSVLVMATMVLPTSSLTSKTNGGSPWDRLGPWNIFDDVDIKGEAGTLASATSPQANPDLIYAGGQNNGVSSGVLKTTDGGVHWTRNSNGLWDTRVLGVWVHPDDPKGSHVLCGTHSGIYESKDYAESWQFRNETKGWGNVMSFREATIQGKQYVIANTDGGIATIPMSGGTWQKIPAPGGIAPNAYISAVTTKGLTEILTCIGGWGGGQLYYGALNSPTNITWDGPIKTGDKDFTEWAFFPGTSGIYDKCPTPTTCNDGWHDLGTFDDLESCQQAVNATTKFKPAAYTYQYKATPGGYGTHCYASDDFATYSPPVPQANSDSGRAPGRFPGQAIDCANAAVDPNDRNHFLYSEGGSYVSCWESFDGGKTVTQNPNHKTGVYFVMIDEKGWQYTATQAGAFVSQDKGKTWNPYHVIMHSRDGRTIDRVPHDYQNIIPKFRGNNIAFPSDQGLHIVNPNGSFQLISAVGDLHNAMSLSALISPSLDGKSRNIISNIWDWDVVASFDDGATWAGWNSTEKTPGACGEGGGGVSMGTSGYQVMFHHSHWWSTSDGGHNWKMGTTPGTPGGGFDYVRVPNSRVEPQGKCFALMTAPAPGQDGQTHNVVKDDDNDVGKSAEASPHRVYRPDRADPDDWDQNEDMDHDNDHDNDHGNDHDNDYDNDHDDRVSKIAQEIEEEMDPRSIGYTYHPGIRQSKESDGNKVWLMVSDDFGNNWTWTVMPDDLQAGGLYQDPTTANSLYALMSNCLAHSTDMGKTWSSCITATGLTGSFSKLVIKNSSTMFMMRNADVPLRTTDGGSTWHPLTSCAALYKYSGSYDASLSWTGNTLVIHGGDLSAIDRGEYGTVVWKSTDDGDSWTDETGDLVTISPGPGVWYEKDFYFVTRGEGIMVKRNFE